MMSLYDVSLNPVPEPRPLELASLEPGSLATAAEVDVRADPDILGAVLEVAGALVAGGVLLRGGADLAGVQGDAAAAGGDRRVNLLDGVNLLGGVCLGWRLPVAGGVLEVGAPLDGAGVDRAVAAEVVVAAHVVGALARALHLGCPAHGGLGRGRGRGCDSGRDVGVGVGRIGGGGGGWRGRDSDDHQKRALALGARGRLAAAVRG